MNNCETPRLLSRFARIALLTMLVTACVTVNIYFPAAQVENAAEDIVEDIYNEDDATGKSSSLATFVAWFETVRVGPSEAHAADARTVSNAAIRGLRQQIEANHGKLKGFYASGNIGIASTGDIVLRSKDGLSVPQLAQLKRLIAADNEARHQLYKEVAAALKVDATQVAKVQAVFADEWRQQAPAGWWIQDNGGAWKKK